MELNIRQFYFIKSFIEKRTDSDIVFAWGNKKLPKGWKEIITTLNNNKHIKIISSKSSHKNIIRHPGNQGWSKLKGFKNDAELCTPLKTLKIDYI